MNAFSKFCLGTALTTLTWALPALADDVALTIYGDGRALVEDNRNVDFVRGEQVITLPGVSSSILPQSATIKASDMEIIEQNFDFDLLTPQKLMEKAVGEYVEIVKTNPATGAESRQRAKVLSVNNGVVIQIGDQIEVLRDDDIPTRVVFAKVPENLRASPTLSVKVDSARAGTRPANLTYISSGLTWAADYVAVFDENAENMSLQGWATINNSTQTSFDEANLSVVAGSVGQAGRNQYNRYNNSRNNGQVNAGMEAGSAERIGDNYIYPMPGRTTLASNQKKQIAFVDADKITAKKVYEFYSSDFNSQNDPINVDSRIAFSNSKKGGLGEALPQGTVRVYAKDAQGKAQFIGEETIGHISAGSDISMKIGEAFDITVKPTVVNTKQVSKRVTETDMLFEVRNAKAEPVTVYVNQGLYGWGYDYDFIEESQTGKNKTAMQRVWAVSVPANGSTDLTYKVRRTWK